MGPIKAHVLIFLTRSLNTWQMEILECLTVSEVFGLVCPCSLVHVSTYGSVLIFVDPAWDVLQIQRRFSNVIH